MSGLPSASRSALALTRPWRSGSARSTSARTRWPRYAPRRRRVTLLLVGDGPLRAELELAASECVRVLGPRADVVVFSGAADAFVLTSQREGLAFSLLEAMAHGLPASSPRSRECRSDRRRWSCDPGRRRRPSLRAAPARRQSHRTEPARRTGVPPRRGALQRGADERPHTCALRGAVGQAAARLIAERDALNVGTHERSPRDRRARPAGVGHSCRTGDVRRDHCARTDAVTRRNSAPTGFSSPSRPTSSSSRGASR